jgi:PsbP
MKYEKHHTTSLIVREKLWAVSIAAFIVMLSVFYITATQQKASGFTTTTQSLSYNNPEQKITIDYPPDWRVCCEKNGPQQSNPDNMFSVMFVSPTISTSGDVIPLEETMSASITIESLDPPTITLQEHQKKQIDIFSAESPDVKDAAVTSATLSGMPAYRIDLMENFADEFKKVIYVNTIKDGKLYEINFIGASKAIDKYSEVIQKMIESVKIG